MKILNKYTYLFLGILVVSTIVILNFIPNLETEEFDQEVIDDIIEGVTTTTLSSSNNNLNETWYDYLSNKYSLPVEDEEKHCFEQLYDDDFSIDEQTDSDNEY